MTKRQWFTLFAFSLLIILVDQYTKILVADLQGQKNFGPINFLSVENHGVILGTLSHLPKTLFISILAIAGFSVIFIYLSFQFLLPFKMAHIRTCVTLVVVGLSSNLFDQMTRGFVQDIVQIKLANWQTPVMNVADLVQFAGYIGVFFFIFKDRKTLFVRDDKRKNYWINPQYQFKFCITLFGIGLIVGSAQLAFSYAFWNVAGKEIFELNTEPETFIKPFLMAAGLITLVFSILLISLGLLISHRTAGPIYALERHLKKKAKGHKGKLRLRKSDDFKILEKIANQYLKKSG